METLVVRFLQAVGVVVVVALFAALILMGVIDRETPTQLYLREKTHSPSRPFMDKVFKQIQKIPFNSKKALMIAAEIRQDDLPYVKEKGYRVIAHDAETILWKILGYKVDIIKSIDPFPKVDLIMASFILPFYGYFDVYFEQIKLNLNSKGYFIGNFMASDSTIFSESEKNRKPITFHTEDQVKALFKEFIILDFEDVKNTDKNGNVEHYFEVFAQKK